MLTVHKEEIETGFVWDGWKFSTWSWELQRLNEWIDRSGQTLWIVQTTKQWRSGLQHKTDPKWSSAHHRLCQTPIELWFDHRSERSLSSMTSAPSSKECLVRAYARTCLTSFLFLGRLRQENRCSQRKREARFDVKKNISMKELLHWTYACAQCAYLINKITLS